MTETATGDYGVICSPDSVEESTLIEEDASSRFRREAGRGRISLSVGSDAATSSNVKVVALEMTMTSAVPSFREGGMDFLGVGPEDREPTGEMSPGNRALYERICRTCDSFPRSFDVDALIREIRANG